MRDSPALAPPPGNPRFPLMDACRGAAAITIVLGHSYAGPSHGHILDFASVLQYAVQVFFALSGFLLFRPYLAALAFQGESPRARDFFQRRVLRILPAYWVALTVMAALLGSRYIPGAFSSRWWVYYGFGQVYLLHHNFWGIATAWSLCVEVTFYLCLPLIALMIGRLSRRLGWRRATSVVLAVLFVIGPIVRLLNTIALAHWAVVLIERITYALPGEICFFVAGMAVALWSVETEVDGDPPWALRWLTERPMMAWGLAAACLALVATFGGYQAPVGVPGIGVLGIRARFVGNQLLICVFAALVILPAAFESGSRRLPQRVLSWRPLGYVGLVSYGLYLWHAPLSHWLEDHTPFHAVYHDGLPMSVEWLVGFAVILTAGLLAGTASYYLVELPFLRFKRGWRGPAQPLPSGDAAPEPSGRVASRATP